MKKIFYVVLIFLLCSVAFCEKSMVDFNPEFEDRLLNAQKTPKEDTKTFSLFAFTDLHNSEYEYNRLMDFYTYYEKYFDDAVCLGDIVEDYNHSYDFILNNPYSYKVLLTLGNHDVFRGSWEDTVPMEEMYNRFLSPFIDKWSVTYEKGKTYYYKDYPAKKIRLIAIDSMLHHKDSDVQIEWFKNTLNDAREKDLNVICATHFPLLLDSRPIDCAFSTKGRWTKDTVRTGKVYKDNDFISARVEEYLKAVDSFRKAGGLFVCWLSGHVHIDSIEVDQKYNQLCISLETASVKWSEDFSDSQRTIGLKSQDLADAIVVETKYKWIKIIRAGCDTDKYMKRKDIMCISYDNFEVIR